MRKISELFSEITRKSKLFSKKIVIFLEKKIKNFREKKSETFFPKKF
jgi:hypothetical protein